MTGLQIIVTKPGSLYYAAGTYIAAARNVCQTKSTLVYKYVKMQVLASVEKSWLLLSE